MNTSVPQIGPMMSASAADDQGAALVPARLEPTDLARSKADRLNRECFCVTLDWGRLCQSLRREAGDPDFCARLIETRPHLFSNAPLFLPQAALDDMLTIVQAIEAVSRIQSYRATVLAWAPEIARSNPGPLGVFMGYDFHLAADGPKLIEVNTNAGGAFLNALLIKAQRACCAEVEITFGIAGQDDVDAAFLRMFQREWTLQGRGGMPGRIAIVDDAPKEQFLYPEFVLAERFFLRHGVDAVIVDAADLRYEDGRLLARGQPIDLVYNRLVDFSFASARHTALRDAYIDGAIVVTPNPWVHAVFADKRNLSLLSDQRALASLGVPSALLANLAGIPRTVLLTPANAAELWAARRSLFFKPACGHGSKAVYRGDKLTKGVWAEISQGGYVAQAFAAPGERMIDVDGSRQSRKVDVRLYVYDGQVLLSAARLYQGQTTNFRTPGGGFAPVFAI